jgi:hypothetical protein
MTVRRWFSVATLILMLAVAVPTPAAAQTAPPNLAELLPDLILREITLPRPVTAGLSHVAHFSPIDADELDNPAVGVVRSFNTLMLMQLSTFPLGSPAGGFTYTFDETLGTFRRSTPSFGPVFAERAVTMGRNRFNAGFSYQHTNYRSFEGQDLDGGAIKFYLRHEECCSAGAGGGTGGGGGGSGGGGGPVVTPNDTRFDPPFEGDLIEAALSMRTKTETAVFSLNYGLTDRWDIGVLVPLVHVKLDADVQATILRLSTAGDPLTHTFEAGNAEATQKNFHLGGSATGLGDVVLRSQYRVLDFAGGGVAGGVDVRLPTGDQNNLLGAGGQTKMFAIVSGGRGRLMQHANIGYTATWGSVPNVGLLATLGGETSLPDEINYAVGVELVVESRLTIVGDVLGRSLRDAGRLVVVNKPFQFVTRQGGPVQTANFDEFDPMRGNLNLTLATVGMKFNPKGNFLISASVLFPVSSSGLKSRVTPVVGVDYAF